MGLFDALKNIAAGKIAGGMQEGKDVVELQQALQDANRATQDASYELSKVVEKHSHIRSPK